MKRLTIPATLALTVLSVGSLRCASTPAPADSAPVDSTLADHDDATTEDRVADTGRDVPVDVCPDPLKCYSELMSDGDGGAFVVYVRRDGGVSDVACPQVPEGCPVA